MIAPRRDLISTRNQTPIRNTIFVVVHGHSLLRRCYDVTCWVSSGGVCAAVGRWTLVMGS